MKLNQTSKIGDKSKVAKKTINTKYLSLMALTAIFAISWIFPNIGTVDAVSIMGGTGDWKIFSDTSKVTVKPDGAVQITGQVLACQGQAMPYTFSINGNEIVYDWTGVEKVKCPKKLKNGSYETRTFEWHHVHMEVWEGKADNIKDTHEMMHSKKIKPTKQSTDTSSLMKAGDKLNIKVAFVFVEEGKRR
ncbi:hypothetical protein [Nitrosopumilus sp.]|uniref:hypothetical protein n=1 Tax=Nitrosopumilus sp. TaxID=2024843 RepID=UPI003D113DE3